MSLVYLDNAATSYPKPPEVRLAILDAMLEKGGNPGRSSHKMARAAADAVFDGRETIASFFGGQAENLVFTQNATHALNFAIKGLIPPNAHVLLSDIEHNAVLRPIVSLGERGVTYDFYRSLGRHERDSDSVLSSIKQKLTPHTAAVIACHRSNVLPIELPLEAIGDFCEKHKLLFLVDASQSAGSTPIDIEACRISALCAPGHKGLLGPRGSGFVLFGKSLGETLPRPLIEGGSGSDSTSLFMPDLLPERLEAGTLPVEAIAGLAAGVKYIRRYGIDTIAYRERTLTTLLKRHLASVPGVRLYLPERQIGSTVLFNLNGRSPWEVASFLDQQDICLRAGLHCAPLAHRLSGTTASGALRASVGCFTTEDDIRALVLAIKKMACSA